MISSTESLKLLIEKVHENEKRFVDLFSNCIDISNGENNIKRYYDDSLKDMFDHNFSTVDNIDEDTLNKLLEIKKDKEEKHIKISSDKPLDSLLEKGFKKEVTLTMLKENYLDFNVPGNYLIKYKNVRENEEIINDIIATEILYYGQIYGIDFSIRRWNRYFSKIKEGNNGLNFFACFYQNNIVGYCYSYYDNDVVCVDGLLVVEEYRKQYIASNLLKYIAHFYNCPIFLHADDDDTPKEMYKKLGFIEISKSYDYLKLDNNK